MSVENIPQARTGGKNWWSMWFLLFTLLAASCSAEAQVRSALYPANWTPAFSDAEGRFLHDFSYAGYHRGEDDLPEATSDNIIDVVSAHGADNSGATNATAAIQAAINAAQTAGGGVVYLPTGTYRCDASLNITGSNVSLRGDGPANTKVYFTQSAGFGFNAHINFTGAVTRTQDTPLAEDAPNLSTILKVGDATAFAVGDEVALGWVISPEFVEEHGMTGTWSQFNGQWKPFFRREIVAINLDATPHEITLDIPTRYPAKVRDGASLRRETGYISECIVEELALSNAVLYDTAWQQSQIHLLKFSGAKDCVIRNVESFVSPFSENDKAYQIQSGGFLIENSKRMTVAECKLEKAQNRGSGGNGYLFEVRHSGEILYRDCIGKSGRHNFIQNWDFGATGIVWLRCHSEAGQNVTRAGTFELPVRADSEYHHSLAMANLVDQCTIVDGWGAGNRGTESSGAGHSATQCVVWNVTGNNNGRIRSFNYGHGYVIGTTSATVYTANDISFGSLNTNTQPNDYTEHLNNGANLTPQSLYEDQRLRRLGLLPEGEGDEDGEGDGIADGEGDGVADGEGVNDGEGDGVADGEGDGIADGEGDGVADGEAELPSDGEGDGAPDGEAELPPDGEGDGAPDGEAELPADGEGDGDTDGEAESPSEGEGEGEDACQTARDNFETSDCPFQEWSLRDSMVLDDVNTTTPFISIDVWDRSCNLKEFPEPWYHDVLVCAQLLVDDVQTVTIAGVDYQPNNGHIEIEEHAVWGCSERQGFFCYFYLSEVQAVTSTTTYTAPIPGDFNCSDNPCPWPEGEAEVITEAEIDGEGEGDGGTGSGNHSADTNHDGALGLGELLSIIQLYNAGDFSCAPSEGASEDGFGVGNGDRTCPPHTTDYLAQDWIIQLSELLRAIQIYNYGEYTSCESTEDRICI